MISNKEVKRTFKIVLDSYNTNSYTGSQFNANYYIDLRTIINDESAFDKSYDVYCEFISKSEQYTNNSITSTNIYTLQFNFNNAPNILYQYDPLKYYSFIVPIENINDYSGGSQQPHSYFKLNDNMQKPIFLQNIRNMTNINLQLYQNSVGSQIIFSPPVPNNSKYICILTFIEA